MSLPTLIRKNVPVINPETDRPIIDPETKQPILQNVVYVNPAKRYVMPFWQTTDPVNVTVPANGNSGLVSMAIDQSTGHFEVFYFEAEYDGPFTIEIFDEGNRYFLQNRPVHSDTVLGNAQRPFILPETLFINVARGTRQFTVVFNDLSGAENNITFNLVGRRFIYKEAPIDIYDRFEEYYGDKERSNLFMLTTQQPLLALAPNVATPFEFRVTSDSFFEMIKMTAASDPEGTNFDIKLQEFGSGRAFHDAAALIRRNNMWGNAQYPHIPPESYLFERDYRIRGEITNLGPVDADFYLTMIGRRIKYPEETLR
jgi:hypothetical protein